MLVALVVSGGKSPDKINFKDSLLVLAARPTGSLKNGYWIGDEKLTLPMPGNTESLNASICRVYCMYLASMK